MTSVHSDTYNSRDVCGVSAFQRYELFGTHQIKIQNKAGSNLMLSIWFVLYLIKYMTLLDESLNSNDQQFQQYQEKKQSPLTSNHSIQERPWHMSFETLEQAHKYGGGKPVNTNLFYLKIKSPTIIYLRLEKDIYFNFLFFFFFFFFFLFFLFFLFILLWLCLL